MPGDTNGVADIFLRDLKAATTVRISVGPSGAEANAFSTSPSVSADGRFVAFQSDATNLVPGDTNGWADVFVYDRQTGAIERDSVTSTGAQISGQGLQPALSADGRFVAFHSSAPDVVPGDTNNRLRHLRPRSPDGRH